MTTTVQTPKSGPYTGDGSTTAFAYSFLVEDEDEIVVSLLATDGTTVTVQTLSTHYTVSGVGNTGGGNVTFVSAPASGEKVVITRAVDLSQAVDLQNRKAVQPETLEQMVDDVTRMLQDMRVDIDRSVKDNLFNETSSFDDLLADIAAVSLFTTNGQLTTDIQISNSSPAITLTDTDTSADVILSTNNAGTLRLRADPASEGVGTRIHMEIKGNELFTMNETGQSRFGDDTDPTVQAEFPGTSAILIPSGTTAQEPDPTGGVYIRYNTTLGLLRYSDGTSWYSVSTGGGGSGIASVSEDTTPDLGGDLDGKGFEISRFKGEIISGVSGTLSSANHGGAYLQINGDVTIPNNDPGFTCQIEADATRTITFNSLTTTMDVGDVMTVKVVDSTNCRAVLTLATDFVEFV